MPGRVRVLAAGRPSGLRALTACRLNVFEKRYVPRPGIAAPGPLCGNEREVEGEPVPGRSRRGPQGPAADRPAFDLAVNVFTFQPGATLPLVEVHVMEHGLLMLEGQGVYRLGDDWYPVRQGDVIWMAPVLPAVVRGDGQGARRATSTTRT